MTDEKITQAITNIENFLFEESEDNGEKLFLDFARKYKSEFVNSKINESTENRFE